MIVICPHCGLRFENPGKLIPVHDFPKPCRAVCPGSCQVPLSNRLIMFVLYDHPRDFPDEIVCRKWHLVDGELMVESSLFARGRSLDAVREALPFGLTRLSAHDQDDPAIAETWI